MTSIDLNTQNDDDFGQLETYVDKLIKTCQRLTTENRSLQQQQQTLLTEKTSLIKKNEMARDRVEAIISRLKSMERNE